MSVTLPTQGFRGSTSMESWNASTRTDPHRAALSISCTELATKRTNEILKDCGGITICADSWKGSCGTSHDTIASPRIFRGLGQNSGVWCPGRTVWCHTIAGSIPQQVQECMHVNMQDDVRKLLEWFCRILDLWSSQCNRLLHSCRLRHEVNYDQAPLSEPVQRIIVSLCR